MTCQPWPSRSKKVREYVKPGARDVVVTFVRQHAKAKQGGPELEMRFAQVWTFRDGLIARMDAGLPE